MARFITAGMLYHIDSIGMICGAAESDEKPALGLEAVTDRSRRGHKHYSGHAHAHAHSHVEAYPHRSKLSHFSKLSLGAESRRQAVNITHTVDSQTVTGTDKCSAHTGAKVKSHDVYYHTHIPKCAGWSICADVPKIIAGKALFRSREVCMNFFWEAAAHSNYSSKHIVMIRQPHYHVVSQFQECTHDRFFTKRAPYVAPNNFTIWLEHFEAQHARGGTKPMTGKWGLEEHGSEDQMADDYSCYNPVNMMVRQLSENNCKVAYDAKFSPHHRKRFYTTIF